MECINAIVVTTLDQTNPASVWDSGTGTLVAHYRGSGSIPRHCLSISGGYLYASERGKPFIQSWPLNKQHCESRRLIAPGKIDSFDFSPDTSHVAVAVSEKLHLYQTSSGRMLGISATHYQPISVVKFNQSGSLIACGGQDGMLTVWTLANLIHSTDPLFSSMDHNLPISDLCFTSGSLRSRVISVSADFSCKVFDVASGKQLLSIAFPSRPTCLALAPNETAVFVGNSDGGIFEVNLFDKPRKPAEYHQPSEDSDTVFAGHDKPVSCLAVSRDSQFLISGSHDESVRIWHIDSHQCVRKLPQKGAVTNLIFKVFSSRDFSTEFKPKTVTQTFIKPSNEEAHNDTGFEITISDNQLLQRKFEPSEIILPPRSFQIQPKSDATPSLSEQEAHLKLEMSKLKQINNDLYKYAVKTVLDEPTGVAYDNVVPFANVKMPKIKKVKSKGPKTPAAKKKEKMLRKLKRQQWKLDRLNQKRLKENALQAQKLQKTTKHVN